MNDVQLRAYLLGRLPPEDAERLEERVLEDEDLYLTLRSVENDLYDDYARGRLSAEDVDAFRERLGRDTRRIRFARIFASRRAAVIRFPVRWMAAAAAVLAVGFGAFFLSQRPSPVATPRVVTREGPPPAPAVVHTVAVTIGASRSDAERSTATIPTDASIIRLEVVVDPDDVFDSYTVEVRDVAARLIWRADGVPATPRNDRRIVTTELPADRLADGPHEVVVIGGGDRLGFAALTVIRAQ